ncbi:hemolysin III family protein [Chitinophaga sedimenti]|uniref:PAQR family membrane homeostasis protein TrhA n=1 Tax=Chitinophaga sedimenti TaxID=2033606 RepID=UPI00200435AF|nr:hemolysin III family protein [Chitinophaga sedimenti]MCK7555580.1 hemolysin III family protein [Chitinophaga sedimenti]
MQKLNEYTYTHQQESVNGLIHGLGILFGLSGLPVLTGIATAHHNTPGIIGAGIYGFCFLMLFTCSTVFHLLRDPVVKRTFEILDHISIYFLIAGTYTPFLLVYFNNAFGITLLSILWGLALVGTVVKSWFTGRFNILSTIVYLIMGWIMVVGGRRFIESVPLSVMIMIAVGGLLYSIGVYYYLRDRRKYAHAVWHSFVLAGAMCHYVAVLLAM